MSTMNDLQASENASPAQGSNGQHGKTTLNSVLIAANALGATGYVFVAATVDGWETCDIHGADGGAGLAAGIFLLPVLVVVALANVVCLVSACCVYAGFRYWQFNRYVLAVPVCWALAAAIVRCPR